MGRSRSRSRSRSNERGRGGSDRGRGGSDRDSGAKPMSLLVRNLGHALRCFPCSRTGRLHRHFSCLPTWPAYKITPQRFLPAGRTLFVRSLRGGGDFGDRLANTDSRIVPALTFSGTARFATYTSRRTSTPKSPKALHLSSSLTDVTPR